MSTADAALLRATLAAQDQERARIAAELHEDVGQALKAIILGLDRLGRSDGDVATVERQRLRTAATQSLEAVRRIALDSRPPTLDEFGLAAAIRTLAREAEARGGPPVEVLVTTAPPREDAAALPAVAGTPAVAGATAAASTSTAGRGRQSKASEVEVALYRVAKEALANVVQHAQAGAASVVVSRTADKWSIVVEDDGVGFDAAALAPDKGLGLACMRARLVALGGSLDVESAPGGGTSVYGRLGAP